MTGLTPPRVLSIAGTDPTGGAGVQADLKSIAAAGGYGMAVVTALVAQNTRGVRSIHTPPASFLREQLDAVSDDVAIDAVKIGMLGTGETIACVTQWLADTRPPLVVLDPVMVATSGHRLIDADATDALRALLPFVDLVTPNIPELAILADAPVAATWPEVLTQAAAVSKQYGVTVLAKGGHLDGADAPDALVTGTDVVRFPGVRVDTSNTHGTGCSLSSGIAARAARMPLTDAVAESKRWLTESLRHADALDVGTGRGPVSHFAGLWSRGGLLTRPTASEVEAAWWHDIAAVRDEIDGLAFVRALGDGSLAADAFTRYLAQDAVYLQAHSRVLARASSLAPTRDEQAFWAHGAQNAVAAELELHTEWLGNRTDVDPTPVTAGYLAHLASSGEYAVMIAALLPCYWLYQDVGARLHGLSHAGHPYASWLDTYADETFAAATRTAIDIVTRRASEADDGLRERMRRAFVASAEHEREFFAEPLRR